MLSSDEHKDSPGLQVRLKKLYCRLLALSPILILICFFLLLHRSDSEAAISQRAFLGFFLNSL